MAKVEEIAKKHGLTPSVFVGGSCNGYVDMPKAEVISALNDAMEWAAQQCENRSKLLGETGWSNRAKESSDCAAAIRAGKSERQAAGRACLA